ncbi:MAG TPA: multidrug efflux SMR transporter [Verrucomicrobiae bacterium]|jgi:quaternary ammonium compound-resistance protein SugE
MAWTCLIIAGLLEIGWAIGMKYTEGFTRLWPTVGTAMCLIVSFFLLSWCIKTIPMGTAYAVWTGIGAAGVAFCGMLFFNEPRETGRVICLVLIVAGTVGLKLFSGKAS